MEAAADGGDLTVLAPDGSRSRFEVELCPAEKDGRTSMLIKGLVRTVL